MSDSINKEKLRNIILRYFQSIGKMNLELYLANFTKNVHVRESESPIMHNHEELSVFFTDNLSLFKSISISPTDIFIIENKATVKWKFSGKSKSDKEIKFEGIDVLKFSNDGKIEFLEAYWELDNMLQQIT